MSSEATPERLVWDPVYVDEICKVALRYIQENSEWRLNEDGDPLPDGVDLIDTGDMLIREVTVHGGMIIFREDHAEVTHQKYKWAGIPPQRWEEFLQEIQPLVDAGLSNVPA